jgi:hypothetical protein
MKHREKFDKKQELLDWLCLWFTALSLRKHLDFP